MFNVGDLVIGNSINDCYITRKGAICLVLDVNELYNSILVCVIADDIN